MDFLTVEHEDGVAIATINRPPANALSRALIEEIDQLLNEIENNDLVRVVVLRGEGRFFSAGADIKEFTNVTSGEEFSELSANGQRVFERIERYSKPVIASIHGAALGGGLELAMACHIRYVTKDAKLGLPELQLGLIPGFGGTQRLPRYVGIPKAAEMMLTSEPILGEEAVQLGLANKALSDEALLEETLKLAKEIAKKSPVSMEATLAILQFAKPASYYDGLRAEAKAFGDVFISADGKEGIQAFLEKRTPVFKGK